MLKLIIFYHNYLGLVLFLSLWNNYLWIITRTICAATVAVLIIKILNFTSGYGGNAHAHTNTHTHTHTRTYSLNIQA